VSYAAANRQLERLASSLAPRMQLVDWAGAVAAHPDWVPGADGVHADATGYQNRALLYAQAIRNCRA
jgi:lysophospholipase L1-like esterase